MSRVCAISQRGTRTGNQRSHSKIATRRTFRINVQKRRINGKTVLVSTRELRTLQKAQTEKAAKATAAKTSAKA